jgi:hypothetical protein
MRKTLLASCLTGLAITFLLGACAAQVDEPLTAPEKDEVPAAAATIVPRATPAATATTKPNVVDYCATIHCTSNAECESFCHEPSSKCTETHHCLVP